MQCCCVNVASHTPSRFSPALATSLQLTETDRDRDRRGGGLGMRLCSKPLWPPRQDTSSLLSPKTAETLFLSPMH